MPNLNHYLKPKAIQQSAFMEEKIASLQQYLFLFLCIPFVASSYHARLSTSSTPKSLKFSMKPRHHEHPDIKTSSSIPGDMLAPGIPDAKSVVLFVNMSIGNPPVPQLLIMDTGSGPLWIQCTACTKCFPQDGPVFDPTKSLTFRNLSCDSDTCDDLFGPQQCNLSDYCSYNVSYVEGSSSVGTVGMEEVHLLTSDEGLTSVDGVVFGCGIQNNVPLSVGESGILGLNANAVSLPSQVDSNFSYCIGNLNDHNYAYNQLVLGEKAKMEGYSTPLEVYGDFYYLTLEGISIGEERLEIDPMIFRRSWSGQGGVIIDSGTSYTELSRVGYEALEERVSDLIGSLLERKLDRGGLCYWGSVSRDMKGFPVVTLHLADGADLVLDTDALFHQHPGGRYFCMAVVPVGTSNVSIIGLMAQQYYNVGFDLGAKKLYLQRIDCELLED